MAESKARGLLQALAAGGVLPALPAGLAPEEVARAARLQGLSGLLLAAAEAQPSSWAGPLVAGLAAERRVALVRALGQVVLAGEVMGLLEQSGIRALPLKGVVLAETVCDVESDRPMSDVDILALERWPEAVAFLERAGFVEFARGDHAWAFRAPASETLVELHRSVTSCPGLFPLDPDAVWGRARPGPRTLPRLPASEDLLVHLALHASFQHGLVLSLVQWLDFRRVLEREAMDHERLRDAARASRAEAPLAAALLAAEAVVAAPLGPALRETLLPSLPRGLQRWLGPRLSSPLAFVHPEPPDLARVRWELMAGRRAALLWRTLVVPAAPGETAAGPRRAARTLARGARLVRESGRHPPGDDAADGDAGTGRALPPEVPFREEVLRDCLAFFPWVRLTVSGRCMEPALPEGARVHLVHARRRRPRLGDVVLLRGRDGLRLHRLVWGPPLAPPGTRWRTKADRGRLLDPPLDPSEVLATVVAEEEHPEARSRRPGTAAWSLLRGLLARLRLGAPAAEATP
jgi:hypothetical protein